MKRLKTEDLSKLSHEELVRRLNDLRSELSTLRGKAARGTLKKELGEIKSIRRNLARILTAVNAEKRSIAQTEMRDLAAEKAEVKE